jgi:hypothetical protein
MKHVAKKMWGATLLVLAFLLSMVMPASAAPAPVTVNIGDYIQFGQYNNAPILWRVVHKDGQGNPVLLSDRILSIKFFDAAGSYHTGNADRVTSGSNYYKDSNIRQWLNSSSLNSGGDTIDWTQNDPIAANAGSSHNPYSSEKGFLADGNFTASERGMIKPFTHKVVIPGTDQAKKDGGTTVHAYNTTLSSVLQNYDTTAYFQNVTDNVFLLSVKQLKEWVFDNSATLGATYQSAIPTAEAVTQSTFKSQFTLTNSSNYFYMLNSPFADSVAGVRIIDRNGNLSMMTANTGNSGGVRPVLQLDLAAATTAGVFSIGSGTSAAPYNAIPPNYAPTNITLSSSSVAENAGADAVVGTLSATDANTGDTATFSLVSGTGSTDNASFNISGNSLRANANLNFETKSSYSVRVRVTDSGSLTFEKAFTISVTNVNEAPTDISITQNNIAENAGANFQIAFLFATDVDAGSVFTFTLANGAGDTDNAKFNIGSNSGLPTLRSSESFDFETKSSYSVRIRVSDGGLGYEEAFTIVVTNVNEAPTDIALSNSSITEGSGVNSNVGELSTTDPDSNSWFYSLVAGVGDTDNSNFKIGANKLQANVTIPNRSVKSSHSVRIRSSDGALSYEEVFIITVTEQNWAPTDINLSTNAIAENAGADAVVGTLSAVDVNTGDTHTYTLFSGGGYGVVDNASFNISGNSLRANSSFDFETKSSYTVNVRATDSGGFSTVKTFTILVSDTDDTAPSAPSGFANSNVTASGFTVTWNAATDNVGVTGYEVYNGNTLLTTTSLTSYTATGLASGELTALRVRAVDAAGNQSAFSSTWNVRTTDNVPTSVPTNVNVQLSGATSLRVTWSPSTDNVAVRGYNVFSNKVFIGSVVGTRFTITGLEQLKTYQITVMAFDAAKNRSAQSPGSSVSTPELIPPPTPGAINSSFVSKDKALLSWGLRRTMSVSPVIISTSTAR